jgi:hypothetical protein
MIHSTISKLILILKLQRIRVELLKSMLKTGKDYLEHLHMMPSMHKMAILLMTIIKPSWLVRLFCQEKKLATHFSSKYGSLNVYH